jgi:hypothetical protein
MSSGPARFEHAVAVDVFAVARMGLQDAEDDVLLARAGHALHAHGIGHLDQLVDRLGLEDREVHRALGGREIGLADDLGLVYFEHLLRQLVGTRPAVVSRPVVRIAVAVAVAMLSTAATTTTMTRALVRAIAALISQVAPHRCASRNDLRSGLRTEPTF